MVYAKLAAVFALIAGVMSMIFAVARCSAEMKSEQEYF